MTQWRRFGQAGQGLRGGRRPQRGPRAFRDLLREEALPARGGRGARGSQPRPRSGDWCLLHLPRPVPFLPSWGPCSRQARGLWSTRWEPQLLELEEGGAGRTPLGGGWEVPGGCLSNKHLWAVHKCSFELGGERREQTVQMLPCFWGAEYRVVVRAVREDKKEVNKLTVVKIVL